MIPSRMVVAGRRRRSRPLVLAGALAVVLAASCTADEAGDDAAADEGLEVELDEHADLQLLTDGVLTVCSEASYPPFEYPEQDSPSGYSGFDIELLDEVADRLGLDGLAVVETGFEDIVSGAALDGGTCDVGASAITITSGRAERLTFTEPYYISRRALLVPSGSDVTSLEQLERGMVLGVQSETAAADRAAEDAHDVEIRTFDEGEDLYAALADGEIDAALHDHAIATVWAEQDDGLEVVEEYRRVDQFGFAVARGRDDELAALLDRALEQVRADGTYDALFERFFGVNG